MTTTTTEERTPDPPPADLPRISGHQDALDGVRAVAALAVLVFHVAADTGHTLRDDPTAWLLSGAGIGVPVFFTLSGLLLYRPWAAALLLDGHDRPRTGRFLWRRAVRILPAYWLVVVFAMVTILTDHTRDPWTWLKLLTLTYPYDPHPWWHTYLGPSGLGQMWSLTVEAAWYALLPVTAALLGRYARRAGEDTGVRARRLLRGIAGYAAVSFVFTIFMFTPRLSVQLGVFLPRYFAWFAIGMALSVMTVWARTGAEAPVRFCRTIARSWGTCWAIAGVLYCVAASPLTGPTDMVTLDSTWTSELRVLLYGLVAAFFVAPVALAGPDDSGVHRILGNRVMRFLGRISYGVFLWQLAVSVTWYRATGHAAFTGGFLTAFPAITAITLAAATLSFHALEKPALRLTRRRNRSPRTRL
ncbi:acyltransferase family protein [Actinoallomurus soli]|uniref:acyltransferase family protein n=1 Tax=Actinoallomurus soli TaxID=2952535 RepID=UPI00209209F2|nr:acyltransferase [Actinoallomurus soli]MCO5973855.1 acyltransferase [Actinoallomurus soli]